MAEFDQGSVSQWLTELRGTETKIPAGELREEMQNFAQMFTDVPPIYASIYEKDPATELSAIRQVRDAISTYIAERKPASIIRISDGEGRVLGSSDDKYEHLSRAIVTYAMAEQFGLHSTGMGEIRVALEDAVRNCEVLGLPVPGSIDWHFLRFAETKALGGVERLPQISGVVSAVRHCHRLFAGVRPPLIADSIFSQHLLPYYPPMLHGLPFVGIITCRQGLDSALRERFTIREAKAYLIPGEAFTATVPSAERHYPNRYHQLLQSISVPFPGAVFLVAAGIPGASYCNRIKQLGGIAINIGSVADVWAGVVTRPYHTERYLDRWRLVP